MFHVLCYYNVLFSHIDKQKFRRVKILIKHQFLETDTTFKGKLTHFWSMFHFKCSKIGHCTTVYTPMESKSLR